MGWRFLLVLCFGASPAFAHEAQPNLDEIEAPASEPASEATTTPSSQPASLAALEDDTFHSVVSAQREHATASETSVRSDEFLLRPSLQPANILQVVPGLFVAQHQGGGKANQYFLRGFDADHGTDVALFVDGVPVNLVSHAHGQGYADMNFIIPELVQRIDAYKGPYFAQFGDFSTAGAITLSTRASTDTNQVSVGGGLYGTFRGLAIASPTFGRLRTLIAAEAYGSDGPFVRHQDLRRFNLLAKATYEWSSLSSLAVGMTSYASGWYASGQVPERAVAARQLGRFDSVDPSEGGASQRHSVFANLLVRPDESSDLSVNAYVVLYRMALFSNFTFFARDPVNGDEIQQDDGRVYTGLDARYSKHGHFRDIAFKTTLGVQARHDLIDNDLYDVKARERLARVVDANIKQGSIALYLQEDVRWLPWLRTLAAVRVDYFNFDVKDRLEDLSTTGSRTSGVRQALTVSPKASLVVSPLHEWDLFANFGLGYHSNDARGVVRQVDPATPLTRSIGGEVGTRVRLLEQLDLSLDGFLTDLSAETVWSGDEGTTEIGGATRRIGVEGSLRWKILAWLSTDLDATWSRAIYTANAGNANAVALAPTFVLQAGVSARHPNGLFGRIGGVFIGERPATEDGALKAQGFFRLDLTAGYRHEWFELAFTVQNLLDTAWREAQFANVSRLQGETSCSGRSRAVTEAGAFVGCEDVHFTPGTPINIQANARLFF